MTHAARADHGGGFPRDADRARAAYGSSTSSDDDASGSPTVEITSIQLTDSEATLGYTAEDGGDPVTVTIDWGDDSPFDGYNGVGG